MAEEDFDIDMPDMPGEPHAIKPKSSLIAYGTSSSINRDPPYKSLSIVKSISESGAVFLVHCKNMRKNYAMKLFKSQDKDARRRFKNEIRFASLSHPNIIRTVHYERSRTLKYKSSAETSALILTEFAPYGDLFDLLSKNERYITEKLIRTYFKQLIEGLEYLHEKSIAHLDLKLENLFLGDDFQLKIADFDLSCFTNDSRIISKGSRNYRAPEIINGICKDGKAADIYSAGIILFVLRTKGTVPHTEYEPQDHVNFFHLLLENNHNEFWKQHCIMQQVHEREFSTDFKELANGLLKFNPRERLTIQQIKETKWYKGPIYTNDELKNYMSAIY